MPTYDSTDLDQALDESGVAHEVGDHTDHSDASTLSKGYSYSPLLNGLVGWWPLSWTNGVDLSGNANHGTLNGGVTTGVAGRGGLNAMDFDGTDDEVTASTQSIAYHTSTISFWWKAPSQGNYNRIIKNMIATYDDGNGMGIILKDKSSAGIGDQLFGSIQPYNEWGHVAVTYDNTALETYVYSNGEQVGVIGENMNEDVTSTSISIGSKGGGDYTEATMADVRVNERVLLQSEIQTLYDWGLSDSVLVTEVLNH